VNTNILTKTHVSQMGYSIKFREIERGSYVIRSGGRDLTKKSGAVMVYRGLQTALNRFDSEVGLLEGLEALLILAGKWHPIRFCDGGCGLEMRVVPREYPDGRVVTVEEQMNERCRCVSCGPFDISSKEGSNHGT